MSLGALSHYRCKTLNGAVSACLPQNRRIVWLGAGMARFFVPPAIPPSLALFFREAEFFFLTKLPPEGAKIGREANREVSHTFGRNRGKYPEITPDSVFQRFPDHHHGDIIRRSAGTLARGATAGQRH